ncbi:LysM peptidoglycan-binding domain-containing protein [Ruoffia tabacinasalis]|uniref:LysM peptidoglycan-binding domain-containing protein n=1 Tax=Ruoffia tabacinasalis TaxID=87458 RepID=A0A5R9DXB4_9LACT|nr:LysM peptidoglycan-binding domain-containing protein [Ruoffia tabacinasalis]TLQ41245.1 LysM peptidoglycan-binding domain-containing protein [Ruoffia tabacinasalis]
MRKSLKLVAATIAVSASSMAINSAEAQVIGDNEASGTWTERSIVDVADSINKEIAETGKYTIQWGDTLSVIAEALGLSVEEVTVLNQLENPDLIIAGSTLAFNEEHHQVTFANEDLGEEVTYSTETGEEVEPVETEEVIEEVVEPEVTEPMTEDGLVLNTVEEWIAPETQEVEAAEEVSEFTYETAEVTYPENLVTWEEEVTEEVVAEETPVVEEETTEVVEETPVVEEIVEEEIVEEVEEPTYETDLTVPEETQPWEVVEEEEPVVEEPVYVEPEVEEPVVEEPVVEEPASGSIDYYSASLGSMPENAGLSESELAAKLEIRRRESTHNYDIYSVSGNHYGAYQMLDSYFTTYGYGDRSPASQEAAANGYVASRYGSWQAALAHHNANNWY